MTTWCNRPITEPILLAPHRSAHVELGPEGICLTGPPGYGERVGHSGDERQRLVEEARAAHREHRYDATYRALSVVGEQGGRSRARICSCLRRRPGSWAWSVIACG